MGLVSFVSGFFRRGPRQVTAAAPIRARYDAATDLPETRNIWSATDALDADGANSLGVRRRLRERSRYARASDGECSGMVRSQSHYVIGLGPTLRVQTQSPGFNAMVEAAWQRWWRACKGARKLRTMDKAKTGDGEAMATIHSNPRLPDQVKLDFKPLECDRFTDPDYRGPRDKYIDGITFDDEGNPVSYDILDRHPGSIWFGVQAYSFKTWDARFVLHWFNEDRPEQHRGVPEYASTLNLFATSRRYREAVVGAAETAADFSVIMKTPVGNDGADEVRPFVTFPIEKRMMVAAPVGQEPVQMRAEQPTTTYDAFTRAQTREKARPLCQSYSVAAADNSGSSFSGGRLDQTGYYLSVDVERDDCELLVVDRLFALWYEEAAREYGWTGDATIPPPHLWAWPAMPQIDDAKTATARQTSLKCGATRLGRVYEEDGLDFDDEVALMAAEYGVTEQEIRQRLLDVNLSMQPGTPAAGDTASTDNSGDPPPANASGHNGHASGHNRIKQLMEAGYA